jgi:hypothetical protein
MTEKYSFFGGKITMNVCHNEEEKETVKGLTVGELLEQLEQLTPYEEDRNKVVFIKSGSKWETIEKVYLDPDDGQVLITLK